MLALSFAISIGCTPPNLDLRWPRDTVVFLQAELKRAHSAADPRDRDRAFLAAAQAAYQTTKVRTPPDAGALLERRAPGAPQLSSDHRFGLAVLLLHKDLADRQRGLAAFTRSPREAQALRSDAEQNMRVARALAARIELELPADPTLPGLRPARAPLPPMSKGQRFQNRGVRALVRPSAIEVQGLSRMALLPSGGVPPDATRDADGVLVELRDALSAIRKRLRMMSQYDRAQRRHRDHLQLFLPAAAESTLLDEIARAARKARFHTVHLATWCPAKKGLREVELLLGRRRSPSLRCAPNASVTECLAAKPTASRVRYRGLSRVD